MWLSRVVTLRKAGGARLKGLCPFHNEKTPSFHVDPDKGLYHCFGCGKSGDIIAFVRDTEQLGFTEAVETLGQRFGVPIEYEEGSGPSREERSLRQEIFEIHELAAEHYHQALRAKSPTGDFMRAYWTEKRRFAPEIAEEFKVGAAAPADDGLAALLWKRKFSEDALRQCGLFFVRDDAVLALGALRPRFRRAADDSDPRPSGARGGVYRAADGAYAGGRSRARGQIRQFARDADLHEGQPALQPRPRPHGGGRRPAVRAGRGPARRDPVLERGAEDRDRAARHLDHRIATGAAAALFHPGRMLLRQ